MSGGEDQDDENRDIAGLLQAILTTYGFDFRRYAPASLRRRVRQIMLKRSLASVAEFERRIVAEAPFFRLVLGDLTVSVTEMFRHPSFFVHFRRDVLPLLRTYPTLKIWIAGCASGEEAYSVAMLLQEEGLYDRALIHATDLSPAAIERAREGIYPLEAVRQHAENYRQAGGRGSFSSAFIVAHGHAAIDPSLKRNVHFAEHNLAADAVFGEMHVILCRNVLIYFDRSLQDDTLALLNSSLIRGGFLCLGASETLARGGCATEFAEISPGSRIYRKKTS